MPPLHTVSQLKREAPLAQVTQTRAGPRKTIDSSRINPSKHGLFAAVAPKPIRTDEYPAEASRIKQPPPGSYDEHGAQNEPPTRAPARGRLTVCLPGRAPGRAKYGRGLESAVCPTEARPVPQLAAANACCRAQRATPSWRPGVCVELRELAARTGIALQSDHPRAPSRLQAPGESPSAHAPYYAGVHDA